MRLKLTTGVAVVAMLALAGCSGGDEEIPDAGAPDADVEVWPGEPVPFVSGDFDVALWSGDAHSTTVECSGDRNAPTMTVTSPEGDELVLEPGPPVVLNVTTSEGHSYSREDDEDLEIGSTTGNVRIMGGRPLDDDGSEITDHGRIRGEWTCSE